MITIDHMLNAALKAGWIQVGPGVPVFFRIDPLGENIMTWADGSNPVDYCVRFALAGDWKGYYDCWNDWISQGLVTQEKLNSDINRIFGNYTNVRCPIDSLAHVSAAMIADYFHSDRQFNNREYYEKLHKTLKENATIRIQEQVCDQPVIPEGLEKHVPEAVVQSVDTGKKD